MADYDHIDADWSWDGDFAVDGKGDLKDTSYDTLKSLQNEIHTICRSEFGDWENHPVLGANLSEFRGEPNTRAIGQKIQDRLSIHISSVGLVNSNDLSVRVVPVHIHRILIILTINAAATVNNNLTPGDPLVVSFTYDSLEDSIFFLPPSETEKQFLRS